MFAHGLPPPCAGIIGFRRVCTRCELFSFRLPSRRGAGATDQIMINQAEPLLGVRQTDQCEMMWFELMHGPPAKQPYLLLNYF